MGISRAPDPGGPGQADPDLDGGGDRDLFNPNVMHDWVAANEAMACVCAAKNYHYQFVFARNAGQVDGKVKQQRLPEALEWLWQGYQPVTKQRHKGCKGQSKGSVSL